MSPTGLRKFLDGSAPYSATRRKIERWYVREATRAYGVPDRSTVLSALRVLVQGLPTRERADGARRLIDAVRESYTAAGQNAPAWLLDAESEWGGSRR